MEGPATSIKFPGLLVDAIEMIVKIPEHKLADLKLDINYAISCFKKKITLQKLQSLIGKLNFACKAIAPNRAFCRRLINITCKITSPFHR